MLRWTFHQDGGGRAIRAVVPVEDRVYCFGGEHYMDHRHQLKVHVFSLPSLSWSTLPPVAIEQTGGQGGERPPEVPFAARGFTAALIDHAIYLWGGRMPRPYAFHVDTHRWLKIKEVSGTVPMGRHDHAACVSGKVMYVQGGWRYFHRTWAHVHGGWTKRTEWLDNMYKLDTSTMVWSKMPDARGTGAPVSLSHSATIIGTKMYACGSGVQEDVKVFDTETETWLDTPKRSWTVPWPRHLAFAHNRQLYIVSGHDCHQPQSHLRRFCPETLSWANDSPGKRKRKVPPPVPSSSSSSMTMSYCCVAGDRVLLFGGEDKPDDLHILDFSPSLKTLCKLAAIQCDLERSGLPHNIRWELAAMTTNGDNTRQEQRTTSSPGKKRKRVDL